MLVRGLSASVGKTGLVCRGEQLLAFFLRSVEPRTVLPNPRARRSVPSSRPFAAPVSVSTSSFRLPPTAYLVRAHSIRVPAPRTDTRSHLLSDAIAASMSLYGNIATMSEARLTSEQKQGIVDLLNLLRNEEKKRSVANVITNIDGKTKRCISVDLLKKLKIVKILKQECTISGEKFGVLNKLLGFPLGRAWSKGGGQDFVMRAVGEILTMSNKLFYKTLGDKEKVYWSGMRKFDEHTGTISANASKMTNRTIAAHTLCRKVDMNLGDAHTVESMKLALNAKNIDLWNNKIAEWKAMYDTEFHETNDYGADADANTNTNANAAASTSASDVPQVSQNVEMAATIARGEFHDAAAEFHARQAQEARAQATALASAGGIPVGVPVAEDVPVVDLTGREVVEELSHEQARAERERRRQARLVEENNNQRYAEFGASPEEEEKERDKRSAERRYDEFSRNRTADWLERRRVLEKEAEEQRRRLAEQEKEEREAEERRRRLAEQEKEEREAKKRRRVEEEIEAEKRRRVEEELEAEKRRRADAFCVFNAKKRALAQLVQVVQLAKNAAEEKENRMEVEPTRAEAAEAEVELDGTGSRDSQLDEMERQVLERFKMLKDVELTSTDRRHVQELDMCGIFQFCARKPKLTSNTKLRMAVYVGDDKEWIATYNDKYRPKHKTRELRTEEHIKDFFKLRRDGVA